MKFKKNIKYIIVVLICTIIGGALRLGYSASSSNCFIENHGEDVVIYNTYKDHYDNDFGDMVRNLADPISLSSNTSTKLASIEVPSGTWFIEGAANFEFNQTGYRQIFLSRNSTCSSPYGAAFYKNSNAALTDTNISFSGFQTPVTTTTYYLCGFQNSGTTLETGGRMYAIRIK
ncbi:MAG: hypothetical protein IJ097_00865 [Bacilli bacterium]|nr:hypothetical protein [Bacilli bacterium]